MEAAQRGGPGDAARIVAFDTIEGDLILVIQSPDIYKN
jgi:hypothetical protein